MMSLDPLEAGLVIAGSVERVRDYYVEQARLGVANYFVLMLPFADLTRDEAWNTLDGFITAVIPAVRSAVPAGVSG